MCATASGFARQLFPNAIGSYFGRSIDTQLSSALRNREEDMNKFSVALLAAATALVISPAAHAH
tara:strand:+ start:1865 stop:2056 length:192 start_codon:yes stop_codon:yes gene_type:complete